MKDNRTETFREATEALYAGEQDQAAALLFAAKRVSAAATKLLAKYPEIARDPDMQFLADTYVAAHVQNGLPVEDAIAQAGEQLAEKYGFGKYRESVRRQRARGEEQTDEEDPSEVIAWLAKGRLGNAS